MNSSEQDKKTNLETELHNNIAHNLEYLLSAPYRNQRGRGCGDSGRCDGRAAFCGADLFL